MCGVVATILNKTNNASEILLDGLKSLEYRGYDSAGIALNINNNIKVIKTKGDCKILEKEIEKSGNINTHIGIGHTRWATHGIASKINAHPHFTDNIAIIHNGIIDNYLDLKEQLIKEGYIFDSETDSEILAKLLDYYYIQDNNPEEAFNKLICKIKGSYSIVAIFKNHPDKIIGAKNKTSLIIGEGEQGVYLASDILAFTEDVKNITYLDDHDMVIIDRESANEQNIQIKNLSFDANKYIEIDNIKHTNWHIYCKINDVTNAREKHIFNKDISETKGNFEHYMLKEIHQQPEIIKDLLIKYKNNQFFDQININWSNISKINIIACGSAYYAGFICKYLLEEYCDIEVNINLASEYKYLNKIKKSQHSNPQKEKEIYLVISQSGETLDTLEALKKAKQNNSDIISILNVEKSAIGRESDYILPIFAGAEIGVASTKAFIAQLFVLTNFTLFISKKQNIIDDEEYNKYLQELISLPGKIHQIITQNDQINNIAKEIKDHSNLLFIGRNILYPTILEAALKLKEISYIHAEGYAGGELKHGPISLIDENMPIVSFVSNDNLFDKDFANMQEVVARGAKLLAVISINKNEKIKIDKIKNISKWHFILPQGNKIISPILYSIFSQLFSYNVAKNLDREIDRPRNLAKSVTVE